MKLENVNYSRVAIIFFAQSEYRKIITKPILFCKRKNVALWRKMTERSFLEIKKTKLPIFIYDETCQKGKTFGDKLSTAVNFIFANGYDKVVIIGIYCPKLSHKNLLNAATKLKTRNSVLGADFNGGIYLIGVLKATLNTKVFSSISWQTITVCRDLKLLFNTERCIILPRLSDFNCTSDLKNFLKNLTFSASLKNLLMSLTTEIKATKDNLFFLQHMNLLIVVITKVHLNFQEF